MTSFDPVIVEAAEADLIDQRVDVVAEDADHGVPADPPVEADPVDVAEQALPVPDDDDGYDSYSPTTGDSAP